LAEKEDVEKSKEHTQKRAEFSEVKKFRIQDFPISRSIN